MQGLSVWNQYMGTEKKAVLYIFKLLSPSELL